MFATFYVLYFGFFGIRQGKIFVDNPAVVPLQYPEPEKQEARKAAEKSAFPDIILKLTRIMEQEQPYLDPELNHRTVSLLEQMNFQETFMHYPLKA